MLYHKIQSIFKRDEQGKMMHGAWTNLTFRYLSDLEWRATEKIDGMNIRIEYVPDHDSETTGEPLKRHISFGGRTDDAMLPAKLVDWLTRHFFADSVQETLRNKFPAGVTLYGEGFGEGIRKGGVYQPYQSFILFDVRVGDWWLEWNNVIDVANELNLVYVPVVGFYTLPNAIAAVRGGIPSFFGDFRAEGLVLEPLVPMFARNGDRIITKIKSRDFIEEG